MAFESSGKRPQEELLGVAIEMEAGSAIIDGKDIILLNFIEDIFSSCVIGKLQFLDPYGAFEMGPITGNERLYIDYGQDEDQIISCVIYKINAIEQMGGGIEQAGQQSFELYFVEDIFFDLNHKLYSRSWLDTKTSDIVKDICRVMLNNPDLAEWEDSNEILENFYMPYWRPKDAIKWLIERSSGFTSKQGGYLFYRNRNGVNFITIDKLMSSAQIDNSPYKLGVATTEYEYNQILGWKLLGADSTAMRYIRGGVRRGFDSSTKTFVETSNTYSDSIAKHVILGGYSIFPDISESFAQSHLDGDSDPLILNNIFENDFIKRYNRQQIVEIVVPGRIADRFCGGLIELEWASTDKNQKLNKMMKGYYLIKSITHQWSSRQTPSFTQKLVLLKNGYTDADAVKIVKLVKSNPIKSNISGEKSSIYKLTTIK
jgi:hypothetical protein